MRLLALAFFWLVLASIAIRWHSYWSGERLRNVIRNSHRWAPFGLWSFRGFAPMIAAMTVALLGVTEFELAPLVGWIGPARTAATGLLWIGIALFALAVAVGITGRPRFLVPPSIRDRSLEEIIRTDQRN